MPNYVKYFFGLFSKTEPTGSHMRITWINRVNNKKTPPKRILRFIYENRPAFLARNEQF
jgi:hypothetical protein